MRLGEHLGITRTEHRSGRSVGDARLIVVICDWLSRQLLRHVRKQADKQSVPPIYARHSPVELGERIHAAGLA